MQVPLSNYPPKLARVVEAALGAEKMRRIVERRRESMAKRHARAAPDDCVSAGEREVPLATFLPDRYDSQQPARDRAEVERKAIL